MQDQLNELSREVARLRDALREEPPGPPWTQVMAGAVAIGAKLFLRKSQVFSGFPGEVGLAVTAPGFCIGP
jgi:hypothetical protein